MPATTSADDVIDLPGHRVPDDEPPSVLDVRIRFTPTLPIVRLCGELDISSVHLLADALTCIATAACRAEVVVLDLSGVTFCDVAGLRAVETCGDTLQAAGKELVLYRPPHRVTKLISITGVAEGLCRH